MFSYTIDIQGKCPNRSIDMWGKCLNWRYEVWSQSRLQSSGSAWIVVHKVDRVAPDLSKICSFVRIWHILANVPDSGEAELGCQWGLPLWIEGHWACRCTAGTDQLRPGEKFTITIQNWDCWPSSRRLHGAAWQCRGRPLQTIPPLPPRSAGWCQMLRSKRPSCLQSEQHY